MPRCSGREAWMRKEARGHSLYGSLGLGVHRVSGGLIAMATLDHSSSKAPAHLTSTLEGGCSHRCRDERVCVIGKEKKKKALNLRATHPT